MHFTWCRPNESKLRRGCCDLSNKYNIPIFLIASRRQIDSSKFKGGYVNNWSTNDFSNFVKKIDRKNNIILSRDHGVHGKILMKLKKI